MRTLARIASQGAQAGRPLPRTLAALDRLDVRFYESEVSVIAGQPGTGKSALALTLARLMDVPTLYISADSSDGTQMHRALSMATGLTQKQQPTKTGLPTSCATSTSSGRSPPPLPFRTSARKHLSITKSMASFPNSSSLIPSMTLPRETATTPGLTYSRRSRT
jgi:ABC-type cobalamin/Fe3+-siderophores transport system ATPase subunit